MGTRTLRELRDPSSSPCRSKLSRAKRPVGGRLGAGVLRVVTEPCWHPSDGDSLQCSEHLPASPEAAPAELDDLPELQEARDHRLPSTSFHLDSYISHYENPLNVAAERSWDPADKNDSHKLQWPTAGEIESLSVNNCLAEFANIATGPQSPLLQNMESCKWLTYPTHLTVTSQNLHSYARPPPGPLPQPDCSPPLLPFIKDLDVEVESEACLLDHSPCEEDKPSWSQSWPPTVWHCFLSGSLLALHESSSAWWSVEDVGRLTEEANEHRRACAQLKQVLRFTDFGLRLMSLQEVLYNGLSLLQLCFTVCSPSRPRLVARCPIDHPFFVQSKGWSSFQPSLTVMKYGLPCREIENGDVCLPPSHPEAHNPDDSGVFDALKSFDFTPVDSAAVFVLSSMARQRRASQCGGAPDMLPNQSMQPTTLTPGTPITPTTPTTPTRNKRPMNAFMLFAKRYRVEYTHMYPGKDNRAISVMLGDRWKRMRYEEKSVYEQEAKALAMEQKRLNPDCWKRKRTNSVGFCHEHFHRKLFLCTFQQTGNPLYITHTDQKNCVVCTLC
uniref:HMG box-containing protein 1 n=1 Tax=Eptatretus burgeri TaxID=7764 RepID=A0A8C4RAT7_EPTBU